MNHWDLFVSCTCNCGRLHFSGRIEIESNGIPYSFVVVTRLSILGILVLFSIMFFFFFLICFTYMAKTHVVLNIPHPISLIDLAWFRPPFRRKCKH